MKTTILRASLSVALSLLLALGPRPLLAAPYREPAPASPAGSSAVIRDQAAEKLREAGLSPSEARDRADRMTEAQARHIAEEAPAIRRGGDVTTVILLLVIVGLVAYILYDQTHYHNPQY